jgi:hypothetical protein
MNVPTVMPSPREKIHILSCDPDRKCRFGGGRSGGAEGSVWCQKLDQLLDFSDEQVLHAKAREFVDEIDRIAGKRGAASMAGGLDRAAEMTGPYVKIPAFDPELDAYNEAAENHPDCSSCVAGKLHYHRKKDGSPVTVPDVPRETSGGDDASA